MVIVVSKLYRTRFPNCFLDPRWKTTITLDLSGVISHWPAGLFTNHPWNGPDIEVRRFFVIPAQFCAPRYYWEIPNVCFCSSSPNLMTSPNNISQNSLIFKLWHAWQMRVCPRSINVISLKEISSFWNTRMEILFLIYWMFHRKYLFFMIGNGNCSSQRSSYLKPASVRFFSRIPEKTKIALRLNF